MQFNKKRSADEFGEPELETPMIAEVPKPAHRTAPTIAAVKAYWAQGRETHEAEVCMEQYKCVDAVTGEQIYYIPERDPDTLEEVPEPIDLTGQTFE